MNAQGVATCPPLNGANMLCRFVSSVTPWMHSSSTMVVKQIPNPFRMQLNSLSILLLSIGCNLNHLIWALQIWHHKHILHGWLAWLIARDQPWFYLTSACHASMGVWNRSTPVQNLLPFKGTPINTTSFPVRGSHFRTLAFFSACVFLATDLTKCSGYPLQGHVRLVMRD